MCNVFGKHCLKTYHVTNFSGMTIESSQLD